MRCSILIFRRSSQASPDLAVHRIASPCAAFAKCSAMPSHLNSRDTWMTLKRRLRSSGLRVQDAQSVSIVFADGQHAELPGRVLGTAPERDLAVVCVDATDLKAIEIGSSSSLRLGDDAVALGYPLGLGGPTVTRGIVSGLGRELARARRRAAQEHDSDRRRHQPRQLRRPARRQRGQADRDQHGGRPCRVRRERRLRTRSTGRCPSSRRSFRAIPAAAPAAAAQSRSRAPRASPSRPSRPASSSPVRSSLQPRRSRRRVSSLRPRRAGRPGSDRRCRLG